METNQLKQSETFAVVNGIIMSDEDALEYDLI